MRRVLLTDSLPEVTEFMADSLGNHFQVKTCCKSNELRSAIEQFEPEIMVLDVSLVDLNDVSFQNLLVEKDIRIISVTCVDNIVLQEYLGKIQVQYALMKPVYPPVIVARLLELELLLDNKPSMRRRSGIYDMMLQLGARLEYVGFDLVVEGVLYACDNENFSITNDLYPYLAQICGITEESVEMAMRRCIDLTLRGCLTYHRRVILNVDDDRELTNAEFIKQLSELAKKIQ